MNLENKLSDIKDFIIKNYDEEKTEIFFNVFNKY